MTVEDRGRIDVVAHDDATDEALLVMVEYRDWSKGGNLLEDLQEKLDCYLSYVLDGQLKEDYPHLAGKAVHIQLGTRHPPGERELEFLRQVAGRHLRPAGLTLSWKVLGKKERHVL
jgi:uncharacterized protein DUF6572